MKLTAKTLPFPLPLPGSELIEDRAGAIRGQILNGELIAALARYALAERAEENLRALAAGEALVVATGQQPCFPLPLGLTLMKAATAVALAERLEQRLGRRVVPLFWCASDDSDFAEARGQFIERSTQPPLRVDLAMHFDRRGAFVGDLPIEAAYAELLALPGLPRGVSKWPPEVEETLANRECRILSTLFAGWGLLTLDARDGGMREAALPLYRRYADERLRFAASVDASGDEIDARLGKRPLRKGIGERALFFIRRRRRSLPEEEHYGKLLVERLIGDPTALSPNASLRPVVQAEILPVIAAILGPSEWIYHAQIEEGFSILGRPMPAAYPRMQIESSERGLVAIAPGGRESSPLAVIGNPLADPRELIDAAVGHLDYWEAGKHIVGIEQGGSE